MAESGIYITSHKLVKAIPNAECCDCGKEAADYSGKYYWIIYHGRIVYCPKCAENEGWMREEC